MYKFTGTYRAAGRINRPGISLIYLVIIMTGMIAFSSLAVDYARVQVCKTELHRVADAAARAGASGIGEGSAIAKDRAQSIANANLADGTPVVLDRGLDIEFGRWDPAKRTFKVLFGEDQAIANACHVIARRTAERGTAVPLMFARVLGLKQFDVKAEAIATLAGGVTDVFVNATTNPYIAGMPNGTIGIAPPGEDPDFASDTSFVLISGINVYAGANMTFAATGHASNDPNVPAVAPDGQTNASRMFTKWQNMPEHGYSTITAPPNCLIGVFLSDDEPDLSSPPAVNSQDCPSDFTTAASRNRTTYKPALKQMFFIGDGKTDGGVNQNWVAPPGATRLFLGEMDEFEWNNNWGGFQTKVTSPEKIILVK